MAKEKESFALACMMNFDPLSRTAWLLSAFHRAVHVRLTWLGSAARLLSATIRVGANDVYSDHK